MPSPLQGVPLADPLRISRSPPLPFPCAHRASCLAQWHPTLCEGALSFLTAPQVGSVLLPHHYPLPHPFHPHITHSHSLQRRCSLLSLGHLRTAHRPLSPILLQLSAKLTDAKSPCRIELPQSSLIPCPTFPSPPAHFWLSPATLPDTPVAHCALQLPSPFQNCSSLISYLSFTYSHDKF